MPLVPGLVNMHIPMQAPGIYVIAVDKTQPGQGLAAGQAFSASFSLAKVTIVVDKDINIYQLDEMLAAVGTRWQLHPATKQWPIEGGPEVWPASNRQLLMDHCPEVFDLVDGKWGDYFEGP